MDGERRLRAKRLLREGETMLWTGVPDPGVNLTAFDAFLVPFTVVWTAFAVFAVPAAVAQGPAFFRVIPVVFVVAWLYMVAGRFVVKAARKKKTVYVLTDRRAVVAVGERSVSEAPWVGTPRHVRRHRDGRHVDVVFGSAESGFRSLVGRKQSMPANTGLEVLAPGAELPVAFYDVADGRALLAALEGSP